MVMTQAIGLSDETLKPGRVINLTFGALRASLVPLGVVTGLFGFLPNVAFALLHLRVDEGEQTFLEAFQGLPGENLICWLLSVCLSVAAIKITLGQFAGRKVTVSEALGAVSSTYKGSLGIALSRSLLVGLGMILLIVPGVFAAILLSVALPARIAGGQGVQTAIRRSIELTRNCRLTIFWLLALLTVAIALAALAFVGIGAFAYADGNAGIFGVVLDVVALPAILAGYYLVCAVASATLYHELVRIKEGGDAVTTASVFD